MDMDMVRSHKCHGPLEFSIPISLAEFSNSAGGDKHPINSCDGEVVQQSNWLINRHLPPVSTGGVQLGSNKVVVVWF